MSDEPKKDLPAVIDDEQSTLEKLQNPNPKNLLVLTILMLIIPAITVAASLIAYDLSGDKYLDRSRPGFMPEGDDSDDAGDVMSEDGPVNREVIDNYLEGLRDYTRGMLETEFFSDRSLSDESLGLRANPELPDNTNN